MDTGEPLTDACAEGADEFLAAGPTVCVLATSREPLRVDGEQVFAVPPLAIDADSVTLFLDRAFGASGRKVPDLAAVREICRRLDAIPLAIELAAGQTRHLQVTEIVDRLDERFALLTGGHRRIARQQTLQATIDWSHDLLDAQEQVLLRRVAVFRGSFTAVAAADVSGVGSPAVLASLFDRSLVVTELRSSTTRYRLLETVRVYAEQRLEEAGETASMRDRHCDVFLAQLEAAPLDRLMWTEDFLGIEDD